MMTFRRLEAGDRLVAAMRMLATLVATLTVLSGSVPGTSAAAEEAARSGAGDEAARRPTGVPDSHAFAEGGVETCLRCHDTRKIETVFETPHMKEGSSLDSPAAREQCESCHGPSARHVRFPLHVGNIRFTRRDDTTTKAARNRACLECHRGDERAHWESSPHGFDEITCVDCHVVHAVSDPILVEATQTKRCAESCHLEILEKQPVATPHPFQGEDAVLCTACHDPHGPFDQTACLDCHPWQPKDLAAQGPKARGYHERAISQEISCTECHQGFVHPLPSEIRGTKAADRSHTDTAGRGWAHP